MTQNNVRQKIVEYILHNFVFEEDGQVDENQSLVRSGVVDSTGILELISFVENEFHVQFDDSELVADNFDTINRVTVCVEKKIAAGGPASDSAM